MSDQVVNALAAGLCPICGLKPKAVLADNGAELYRLDGLLPALEQRRATWWVMHDGELRCHVTPTVGRTLVITLADELRAEAR